jgi:hypothetical protein
MIRYTVTPPERQAPRTQLVIEREATAAGAGSARVDAGQLPGARVRANALPDDQADGEGHWR